MRFLIKKAQLENLDEILELFKNTIKKTCKEDYNPTQISAWISSMQNKGCWINKVNTQYFIVVKLNDTIVGFGSLDDSYLDMLFVHYLYLRKGIASLIFEDLKNEAKNLGFNQLTTYSSKTALSFFKSKGFKIIKENKVVRKGVKIDNFEMLKSETSRYNFD